MTTAIGRCMICGGTCPKSMWVCRDCRTKYPELKHRYKRWPPWAKDLAAQMKQQRRSEQRILDNEDDSYEVAALYE